MKNIEIEFNDSMEIGTTTELLTFNVKLKKVEDSSNYAIKVLIKADKRNRRCSFSTIDAIEFNRDFREVINDWLAENDICASLKEDLRFKLEENFEYKYLDN